MASLRSSKWDFLEDDLDGEDSAFLDASELREKANALTHHAHHEQDPWQRQQHLSEALGMYRRADDLLKGRLEACREKGLALQCRLNAACLALQVSALSQQSGERQQAEAVAHRFANAALELDPENPHALLVLARLAAGSRKSLAEQYLRKARMWAHKRKDEDAAAQATELERSLQTEAQLQVGSPLVWVQKGTELFKRGEIPEAERLLKEAVDYMDQQAHGGPIEALSERPSRALAFDALEALAECLAARKDFEGSLECGQRAAGLLEVGALQVPFVEPERSRREGLLFLSLGHSAEAASSKEAISFFRRAAQAFQRSDSRPALEGTALLEFGLRLVQEVDAGDQHSADLAMPTLERALEKLKLAHGQMLKGTSADNAGSQKQHGMASERLLRRQLQCQVALGSLHLSMGDSAAAEEVLSASRHLLEFEYDGPSRLEWASLCGKWAFAAAKVGRLQEAEDALRTKWKLAGGKDPEWGQDGPDLQLPEGSCPHPDGLRLQQEALQSLALVRQKVQDAVGVEDAMSRLSRATPETSRGEVQKEMQHHLQRLAVDPQSRDTASAPHMKAAMSSSRSGLQVSLLQGGACLAALAALVAGLSVAQIETMNSIVWPFHIHSLQTLQNWSLAFK